MNNNQPGDLHISGSGRTSGGLYGNVSISGSGSVDGDLECGRFSVSGSCHVAGSLKAKEASISGSAHVGGTAEVAETLKVSGSGKVDGDATVGTVRVMGEAHFGGALKADDLHVSGSVKVDGDCNAETFTSEGGFYIGGLLNAGELTMKLYPLGSRAQDIGGGRITVTRGSRGFFSRIFNPLTKYLLETGTIEGDDVELEGVKAKVVRGVNVKIGPGCDIDLVEYSGTFEQEGDGVKENRRI